MFVVNHLPSRVAGTMCQIKYLFVVALVCSLFVSCEKEEASDGTIEIFAEAMSGGNGKVLLDGATATWVNGDAIRINSTEVAVERRNDRAYISYNAAEDEVTRAVYPASLASGDLTSDNVTINFPAYYHYRTDASGHQLLDLPMAARSSGRNPLQFKHLTGALYVTVTNTAETTLTLQSVSVHSNGYKLNGSKIIDLTNLEGFTSTFAGEGESQASSRFVTLLFDEGYPLAPGASIRVMVPVMPSGGVGSNKNDFTIRVKSYDTSQNFYLFSQTQNTGTDHVLHRNELGYAPVSITASGAGAILDQENGNYVVRNAMDFLLMTQNITSGTITGSSNIDILSDIDMSGIPITTINNPTYTGTINGNNHTINNLKINSLNLGTSGFCCALFYRVQANIRVKNIKLHNILLNHQTSTDKKIILSGLFGSYSTTNNGTLNVENCEVTFAAPNVRTSNGPIYFGGLLGEIEMGTSHVSITNCTVTTLDFSLAGRAFYWGGFVGSVGSSNVTIENSSWSGTTNIDAQKAIRIGGMIGNKTQGLFSAKENTINGTISAKSPYGQARYLGTLLGYFSTPNTVDTLHITRNIAFTLNDTTITPDAFGVNR